MGGSRLGRRSDRHGRLQGYLLRLGRLLDAEHRSGQHGLQPVQLQALLYLGRANRYSDRPAAVAEYLAITRGTASQSLRVLEERGLISKHVEPRDRRQVHLHLTREGRQVARETETSALLTGAIESLDPQEAEALERGLEMLLRHAQQNHGHVSFGVCQTCRHFESGARGRHRCGLTGEALTSAEKTLLCREHEESASV